MALIVESDPATTETLRSVLGPGTATVGTMAEARGIAETQVAVDTLVIGPSIDTAEALRYAEGMRIHRPAVGVVLVRRRVDTTVLAEALRAGVREVVSERELTALAEAVRRSDEVARQIRHQSGGPETMDEGKPVGTLVTVFAAKGGCGKTTLATNLAAALADRGRREVCLVDLDLAFGDVAIALQLFPAHTIADAVPLGDNLDAPAVMALLTPHSPGLTTLVAPVEPGSADNVPASLVGAVLHFLKQNFEFVVVDTPPAFTDHVLAAFDETDELALMATLDIPSLKNLKLTLETLELLNYPKDRWRIILNRADSKVGLALSEVEKTLRVPISAQIPSSRAVPASVNRGVPIVLDEPSHPVSVAIKSFAERYLLRHHGQTAAIPEPLRNDRRGVLRRKVKD